MTEAAAAVAVVGAEREREEMASDESGEENIRHMDYL